MNALLKKIYKDSFFRQSAVFFAGSMLVAVFNYAYHPTVSRLLNVADFGEVQTLISLFTQLGIFLGAFSIVIVNVTANIDDQDEKNLVINGLRKISFYVVGILFILMILFSSELKDFFNFQNIYPFVVLAFLFPLSLLVSFRSSYLQGRNDFISVSSAGLITAIGRIVFAAALIYLGWKSMGAIAGLVLAQSLALAFVFYKTKNELRPGFKIDKKLKNRININQEIKFGGLVFVVMGCLAFLSSGDVTIVKHYFDPETAGLYSGISAIAKIIFFVTGPIVGVLLPAVKINAKYGENRKTLIKAVLLITAIGGTALLTFIIFSAKVTGLLIGHRYLQYSAILPELSLVFFLVSLVNLFFYYYLALRQFWMIWIASCGIGLIIILNAAYHETIRQVIYNFLWGSVLILLIIFLTAAKMLYRNHK